MISWHVSETHPLTIYDDGEAVETIPDEALPELAAALIAASQAADTLAREDEDGDILWEIEGEGAMLGLAADIVATLRALYARRLS